MERHLSNFKFTTFTGLAWERRSVTASSMAAASLAGAAI